VHLLLPDTVLSASRQVFTSPFHELVRLLASFTSNSG
jgi:hypothetical protein